MCLNAVELHPLFTFLANPNADNVLVPGAPDLLQYLAGPEYAAALLPAPYEYEQR